MNQDPSNKYNTHIFYHANCLDGLGSAYITYLKYNTHAEYIPLNYAGKQRNKYNYDFTQLKAKDNVIFLDIIPDNSLLLNLSEMVNSITVIDHHTTAIQELDKIKRQFKCQYNEMLSYGNTSSACMLAAKYYYPNMETATTVNNIIDILRHIEDRDLWKFSLANTKYITEGLFAEDYQDITIWNSFDYNILLDNGKLYLRLKEKQMGLIKNNAFILGDAICLNSSLHVSELGHLLLDMYTKVGVLYAIIFSIDKDQKYRCSLRSLEGFDVSKVAQKFGGGGHTQAAGCTVSSLDVFGNFNIG